MIFSKIIQILYLLSDFFRTLGNNICVHLNTIKTLTRDINMNDVIGLQTNTITSNSWNMLNEGNYWFSQIAKMLKIYCIVVGLMVRSQPPHQSTPLVISW